MLSLTLENIIQKSYHEVMNGKIRNYCDKMSKLAGFILADIYETYEANKDKTIVTELRMFLNVRDPIKHLISILKNFINGSMSINDAIVNEIRIIKQLEHLVMKKITLLEVIEDEIKEYRNNPGHIRNSEAIAQTVIDKLTIHRIDGNLHPDAESALMMSEIKSSLTNIIKKVKEGNDLKEVLFLYYKTLDEKKRIANTQLDTAFDHFKEEMANIIKCEFNEIHSHVDHMGTQIHSAVIGNILPGDTPPIMIPNNNDEFFITPPAVHMQVKNDMYPYNGMVPVNRDIRKSNSSSHHTHHSHHIYPGQPHVQNMNYHTSNASHENQTIIHKKNQSDSVNYSANLFDDL